MGGIGAYCDLRGNALEINDELQMAFQTNDPFSDQAIKTSAGEANVPKNIFDYSTFLFFKLR